MSALTKEDIMKIGKLARLEIAPEELEGLQQHFSNVLEYFKVLQELDTSDIDLNDISDQQSMPLREDEPRLWDGREALLDQAPNRDGDFIRVPKIGGDQ